MAQPVQVHLSEVDAQLLDQRLGGAAPLGQVEAEEAGVAHDPLGLERLLPGEPPRPVPALEEPGQGRLQGLVPLEVSLDAGL